MAADGGVRYENLIGQGGDELIAASGEHGGDSVGRGGERRQNQQATGSQGLFQVGRYTLAQGAGRANYDGLRAAQEDLQTFLFDRRMEAADDAASGVSPFRGLIVSRKDDFARAMGGTEQCGFGQGKQVEVAEGG